MDDLRKRNSKTFTTTQVRAGWEVECTDAEVARDEDNCDEDGNYTYWEDMPLSNEVDRHTDGSVGGRSLEFVARKPHTPLRAMRHLKEFMEQYHPLLDDSCGVHFHVSIRPKLEDDMTVETMRKIEKKYKKKLHSFSNNLFMLASLYEKRLFETLADSRDVNQYCRRIGRVLTSKGDVKKKLGYLSSSKYSNDKRYCWINFVELYRPNGIRTVEFRALGDNVTYKQMLAHFVFVLTLVWGALKIDIEDDPATMKIVMDYLDRQIKAINNINSHHSDSLSLEVLNSLTRKLQTGIEEITI